MKAITKLVISLAKENIIDDLHKEKSRLRKETSRLRKENKRLQSQIDNLLNDNAVSKCATCNVEFDEYMCQNCGTEFGD